MQNLAALSRAFWSLVLILALLSLNFLSFFLLSGTAEAVGTLSSRSITLGSSKTSTSNTYSVSFKASATTTIKSIVVDFANTTCGPLIGTQCVTGNHPVTGITTSGTVNVSNTGATCTSGPPCGFTAVAPNANIGNGKALVIQFSSGMTPSTANPITFSFTATNPSTAATFYARIMTFSDTASSTNYDPSTTGANNPPTTNEDDQGSLALSTANQISVSARVNELLTFCVGTTTIDNATSNIANDCSVSFSGSCGTTVNLGTLDPAYTSVSPVSTSFTAGSPSGGNACNGAAMVRTNAASGVAIVYFAEQDTSSGKLKVTGASCSGSSNVDQCFNDSSSQGAFTAGTEAFGVTVGGTNCGSTTSYTCTYPSSNLLTPSSGYIGAAGAYGTSNGFAWLDTGSTAQLASSTGPVDDEALVLKFAATPGSVTPTGNYTVTSTYIATATF